MKKFIKIATLIFVFFHLMACKKNNDVIVPDEDIYVLSQFRVVDNSQLNGLSASYSIMYNDRGQIQQMIRNGDTLFEWSNELVSGERTLFYYKVGSVPESILVKLNAANQVVMIKNLTQDVILYEAEYSGLQLSATHMTWNLLVGFTLFSTLDGFRGQNFSSSPTSTSFELSYTVAPFPPVIPEGYNALEPWKIKLREEKSPVPLPKQSIAELGLWLEEAGGVFYESRMMYFLALSGYNTGRISDNLIAEVSRDGGALFNFNYTFSDSLVTTMRYQQDSSGMIFGDFTFTYQLAH